MTQISIFNNSLNKGYGDNNNNVNDVEGNSRLINNTQDLRNALMSRNLYNYYNIYPEQPDSRQNIVNITSKVIDSVMPFKSFNLSNSILGRLITLPNTPIADIGMIMLAKQMGYNAVSNAQQSYLPQMNLSNLFNGSRKTKKSGNEPTNEAINDDNDIFSLPKNFRITKSLTGSRFADTLEKIFGTQFVTVNPFRRGATNEDYLNNTGKQQIGYLYGQLSRNFYKPYDSQPYKNRYGFQITNRDKNFNKDSDVFIDDKIWFNPTNLIFNPFNNTNVFDNNTLNNIDLANHNMRLSYEIDDTRSYRYFYGGNLDFIEDLGKTKTDYLDNKETVDDNEYYEGFYPDNYRDRIVWGEANNDYYFNLNVKHGLLEYTRNLVKTPNGKNINQTEKGFIEKDGKIYYNGNRLIKPPEDSMFSGREYVRQHSIYDQYDRLDKAIRYEGNKFYNGNPNSVIYDTVLPKIAPLNNSGVIDNKNLMFTIENLAVEVDEDGIVIGDNYKTQLPPCEISESGHRIMWFPPYDIKINETTVSTYDSINFLGRVEPVYAYKYSERSANLNFKLLIDYPPQLRKNASFKEYSDFFAFGGNMEQKKPLKKITTKKIGLNQKTIDNLGIETPVQVPKLTNKTTYISFPNDQPKMGNINTIMDSMYFNLMYEPVSKKRSDKGIYSDGLNSWFYYKINTLKNIDDFTYTIVNTGNPEDSQYTHEYDENNDIDRLLKYYYSDAVDNYNKYYDIVIIGKATKLYTEGNPNDVVEEQKYNKALGLRRAEATKYFIEQRIQKIFGKSSKELGINIKTLSVGSYEASPENATKAKINSIDAKMERVAEVTFTRNEIVPEKKKNPANSNEKKVDKDLKKQNEDSKESKLKNKGNCSFEKIMSNEASKNNYQSLQYNNYYPVFHSQTPEDFHNRITFLQQCMRPGNPIQGFFEGCKSTNRNSSFGKQPICVLRVADFFQTKIIIENLNIIYEENESTWDTNPEGFGMQPMVAQVNLQIKIIGGESLQGAIDQLQNAISYNYYANSDFNNEGVHKTATMMANEQYSNKKK